MTRYDFAAFLERRNTIRRLGLVVERGSAGVRANVDHVVYHSPAGMEFGCSGPGPSDLALSALCALIPPPDPDDEERLYALDPLDFDRADADDSLWSVRTPSQGRISRLAWRLHQPFRITFVMIMRGDSGYVPIDIMRSWIEVQSRALVERSCRD